MQKFLETLSKQLPVRAEHSDSGIPETVAHTLLESWETVSHTLSTFDQQTTLKSISEYLSNNGYNTLDAGRLLCEMYNITYPNQHWTIRRVKSGAVEIQAEMKFQE